MAAVSGEMLSACFFQIKRKIGNNSLACQKQLKEGRNPSWLVNKILFIQRRSTRLPLWLFLHENSHRKMQYKMFLIIYFSSVGLQGLKWGHELLGICGALWTWTSYCDLKEKSTFYDRWHEEGHMQNLGLRHGQSVFCISTVSRKIL